MAWKGPSSLLSSLPITNSGSSWTPAWMMKGSENSRPQWAFWTESIQASFTPLALWGFHGNRHMFPCVTCRGPILYSLSLSGKYDHVPLPSYWSESSLPWVSLPFFHVICTQKCRNYRKSHWKHLKVESAAKTVGMIVADQKLRRRPLSCLHLAPCLS